MEAEHLFENLKAEENFAIETSQKTHICEYCGLDFPKNMNLEQHYSEHPKERPHECDECNRRFEEFDQLVDHSLMHVDKSSYKCKLCNLSFKKKRLYVSHSLTHKGRPHMCDICKECFTRVDQLVEHDCSKPDQRLLLSCHVCFKTFKSRNDLNFHLPFHRSGMMYECKLCESNFHAKIDLLRHELTHSESVVCNICYETFSNKSLLENHKSKHKSIRPFRCDYCNKGFTSEKLLTAHVSSHNLSYDSRNIPYKSEKNNHQNRLRPDKKPLVCHQCHKCFLSNRDLSVHKCLSNKLFSLKQKDEVQETSTDLDQFSCEFCSSVFEDADKLEAHVLEHDKKPYVCVRCHVAFQQLPAFEKHILSHSTTKTTASGNIIFINQKTHMCKVCKLVFSSELSLAEHCKIAKHRDSHGQDVGSENYEAEKELISHNLNHKEGNKVSCTKCNESFSRKKDLMKHKLKKHLLKDPLQCKLCHQKFSFKTDVLNHKCKAVSSQYICNVCDEIFNSEHELQIHGVVHSSGKYSCDLCTEVFDQKSWLLSHQAVHQLNFTCDLCEKSFRSENDLITHCLNHPVDTFVCNVCNEILNSEIDLSNHLLLHSCDSNYICDLCDSLFKEEIDFLNHCLNHPPESHVCKLCSSSYYKLADLNLHLLSHSGNENNVPSTSSDDLFCHLCLKSFKGNDFMSHACEKVAYECEKCVLKFNGESEMMQHLLTECKNLVTLCDPLTESQVESLADKEESSNKSKYLCKICNKQFSSEQSRKQHRLSHCANKRFVCDICSEKFDAKNDLVIHRLAHSVKDPHVCNLCSECFPRKQDLMKHRLTRHSVRVVHKCDVCSESYQNKYDLVNHRRRHLLGGPHACSVCNEKFPKRTDLLKHYPVHNSEGNFSCSVCNNYFPTRNELEAHHFIHSFDRPHVCEICKMRFRHRNDLVSHRLVHSQDKPFTCDLCDKSFRRKGLLSEHQLSHLRGKTFSCKFCSKSFSSKHLLDKHESMHSFGKTHACNECGKSFHRKDFLKAHLLVHSKDSRTLLSKKSQALHTDEDLSNSYVLVSDVSDINKISSCDLTDKYINTLNAVDFSEVNASGQISELFEENNFMNNIENSDVLNVNNEHLSMATIEVSNENFMEVVNVLDADTNRTKTAKKIHKNPKRREIKSQIESSEQIDNDQLNSIDPDTIDLQHITFNPRTNQFEIAIDTAVEKKSNILNLENHKQAFATETLSQEAIELCSSTFQLKTDSGDNVCSEVSNININGIHTATNRNTSESKIITLNTENGKFEVCHDISNLVTVVYNDGSNASMANEMCNLETIEVSNENIIPESSGMCVEVCNMEVGDAQDDSSQENQDITNAVSSIQTMEATDNSLEAVCESLAQNSEIIMQQPLIQLGNGMFDKSTLDGNIVLQDLTEINNGSFVTEVLGKNFSIRSRVNNRGRNAGKNHICDLCKRGFNTKNLLLRHMYSHTGEKPFPCPLCDKRFSRKDYLDEHLMTHSGKKPHACHICKRSFHRKNHLEKHIQTHSTEKPYACEICGKCFRRKDYLLGHRLTHDVENPYMCDVCDQTFRLKSDLENHRVSHTVEITYVCGLCNKCFNQKRLLQRHFISHTGEKPYSCDICNKRFTRKDSLVSHLQSHTGERSHVCQVCKKSFFQKFNLLRHLRTHSGEKTTRSSKKHQRLQPSSDLTLPSDVSFPTNEAVILLESM